MDDSTPDPRTVTSTRQLAAPREAVFQAFADPLLLARWWGPEGFSNRFDDFDFRSGGRWKFSMLGPDGRIYPNDSVFESIQAPGRIVIRHRSAPCFTLAVDLRSEDGGTRITWRQRFDTVQLREQLAPMVVPANEQNFDRLEAVLGLR